jgi:hypothetical protein
MPSEVMDCFTAFAMTGKVRNDESVHGKRSAAIHDRHDCMDSRAALAVTALVQGPCAVSAPDSDGSQ